MAEGLFRKVDLILPIVKYIGQAFLSPEKFVKWVWSDEQSTGTNVEPVGKVSYYLLEYMIPT